MRVSDIISERRTWRGSSEMRAGDDEQTRQSLLHRLNQRAIPMPGIWGDLVDPGTPPWLVHRLNLLSGCSPSTLGREC
jgi:hypothetical protein